MGQGDIRYFHPRRRDREVVMTDILIKNAIIVTMDDRENVIHGGDVLIEDGLIKKVGKSGTVDVSEGAEVIDGSRKAVLPGLVNAHTHAAMTLFRGYADDLALDEWLNTKIWPLEAKINGDDVYWGTMLAIVEMIKGGTTCFADMYFYADEIAKAVDESGIRASICGALLGILPTADSDLEAAVRFVKENNEKNGRISAVFGPHALYTCTIDHLKKVAKSAEELGARVHTHLLETKHERQDIIKLNGKEPFDVLKDSGLLEVPIIAAHSIYLTEDELETAATHDLTPVHTPGSNLKLASGIAPVWRYEEEGIMAGLGTDGAASNNNLDMFEEVRLAALIHKVDRFDPTLISAHEALRMATQGGAKALGFTESIGIIKDGFKADLITIDLDKPHLTPLHDVEANIVYSASGADVADVIVDGKMLMRDRELLTIDEEAVLRKAAEVAEDLVGRA